MDSRGTLLSQQSSNVTKIFSSAATRVSLLHGGFCLKFCFVLFLLCFLLSFDLQLSNNRGKLVLVLCLTIHQQSPADVGSCVHGMEFVCWNSSGDTLRCGGGLGLATLRVLNVVQTIILITPLPLRSSPAIVAMYQSVISVTVARGNLNVHTLRCAILRSLDHAATVSFRRLYFVKIKLFSRALATIKFCHKLLNYSLQGNLSR